MKNSGRSLLAYLPPRSAVTALQRLLAALSLALALLVVQQAAAQHPLSHFAEQSGQQQHKSQPSTEQCGKCLALASLSGAPPASQHVHLPAAIQLVATPGREVSYRPVSQRSFSARAPPLLA